MPVFQDSESVSYPVVPEGDYILTVFEFATDLSSGKKTAGCERFNVVFNIEGTDSKLRETLLDHESCIWKIDSFLKGCGIRSLKKGQAFHFEKDKAEEAGIPWINPMGLRCHALVGQETYVSPRSGKEVTKNVVVTYYTDKEVLKPDPQLRTKLTEMAAQKKKDSNTPF
jgi:hypothetical protein